MTKVLFILSLQLIFISLPSQAKVTIIAKERVEALRSACLDAVNRNKTPVRNVHNSCQCLVDKIVGFASQEDNLNKANNDVEWAAKFYAGTLTQSDVDRDQFNIVDYLFQYSQDCL